MTAISNGHPLRPKNILLVGLGSIGSIYAYILERSGRAQVTAIARSNYDQLNNHGVTLKTGKFGTIENWKPHKVVRSQTEALTGDVHYDFVLVATKCLPDVAPTSKILEEIIKSGKVGAWSLIQNGLGNEEDLYQATRHLDSPVITSAAFIAIMTSADGSTVTFPGMQEMLVAGIYPPLSPIDTPQTRHFSEKEEAAIQLWTDLIAEGGSRVTRDDRIDSVKYAKNVINCAWSSIQGLIRGTPDTLFQFSEEDMAPLKGLFREVVDIGFKAGLLQEGQTEYPNCNKIVDAPTMAQSVFDLIWNMTKEKVKNGIPPHKMSLLVDVENGRPFEVEVIVGDVLRLARAHNIDAPLLALTYSYLKGLQANIVKARGQLGESHL